MIASFRFASVLALLAVALASSAAPATYTISGTGSGTLDGTAFTDQMFSLTAIGDTSGIFMSSAGNPTLVPTSTTVTVIGVRSDTFSDTIDVVDNRTSGRAGLSDVTKNFAILFVNNAAFSTYGLATSIGPVAGDLTDSLGRSFTTTHGLFVLNGVTSASFTAVVQATPEPSTLAALGLGAAVVRRRRRRMGA